MPVEIDGQLYYRTSEVCAKAGISRATLFRWIKTGILKSLLRDRRGWRLFTEEDIREIQKEIRKIQTDDSYTKWRGKNAEK